MDWAGAGYEVDFLKKCWFWGGSNFENDIFRERGPRGRSRRENSAKILAAALSGRDFLMIWVLGEGGCLGGGGSEDIPK